MNYEFKHYGKTLEKLSKKENELLMIDMTMTLMFKDKNKSGEHDFLFTKLIDQISIKRANIILDILNLSKDVFSTTIEKLDYIETTDYGYDKFLKDTDANVKRKEIVKRLEVLN